MSAIYLELNTSVQVPENRLYLWTKQEDSPRIRVLEKHSDVWKCDTPNLSSLDRTEYIALHLTFDMSFLKTPIHLPYTCTSYIKFPTQYDDDGIDGTQVIVQFMTLNGNICSITWFDIIHQTRIPWLGGFMQLSMVRKEFVNTTLSSKNTPIKSRTLRLSVQRKTTGIALRALGVKISRDWNWVWRGPIVTEQWLEQMIDEATFMLGGVGRSEEVLQMICFPNSLPEGPPSGYFSEWIHDPKTQSDGTILAMHIYTTLLLGSWTRSKVVYLQQEALAAGVPLAGDAKLVLVPVKILARLLHVEDEDSYGIGHQNKECTELGFGTNRDTELASQMHSRLFDCYYDTIKFKVCWDSTLSPIQTMSRTEREDELWILENYAMPIVPLDLKKSQVPQTRVQDGFTLLHFYGKVDEAECRKHQEGRELKYQTEFYRETSTWGPHGHVVRVSIL